MTRYDITLIVLAIVILGVKLTMPPEPRIRVDPAYIPLLAEDSCAIFEFSQDVPGCVRDGPAMFELRR